MGRHRLMLEDALKQLGFVQLEGDRWLRFAGRTNIRHEWWTWAHRDETPYERYCHLLHYQIQGCMEARYTRAGITLSWKEKSIEGIESLRDLACAIDTLIPTPEEMLQPVEEQHP